MSKTIRNDYNKKTTARRHRAQRDQRQGEDSAELHNENPIVELPGSPQILPRDEHGISRKQIDDDCLKVMRRLNQHGYMAFLVGGAVRDLFLGRQPKDFDLSTDASPEKVRALFRNSRIIGRRFRLNQVYFRDNKIIEVSTFRDSASSQDEDGETQTLARDNTYGDPQTDSVRRDLTINGLFYDLRTFSVIDYVGGIQDLRDGVVRLIGVPRVRITEDPVRMIRVVRHAARTNFTVDPETYEAICDLHEMITVCPKARVFEEFQREISGGNSLPSFRLLDQMGLLKHLCPHLAQALAEAPRDRWKSLEETLSKIDADVKQTGNISIGLALAAMMIGNLPKAYESSLEDSRTGGSILSHWADSPQIQPYPDEDYDIDEEEDDEQESDSRRGRRKRKASPLMDSIDELFEPVGLPRRERELVEELLVLRFHLLTSSPEGTYANSLIRSNLFPQAIKLIEFSCHSEEVLLLVAEWKAAREQRSQRARAGNSAADGKPANRRRRRRYRGKSKP